MGLFDHYRPSADLRCPACQRPLRRWQGKDGPNGLLVWAEGAQSPVDQLADEEVRLEPDARAALRLPARFVIYSYDCPEHRPIEALGFASRGVWTQTTLQAFGIAPSRPQE